MHPLGTVLLKCEHRSRKIGAVSSGETSVNIHQTICCFSEEFHLHIRRHDNLKYQPDLYLLVFLLDSFILKPSQMVYSKQLHCSCMLH
jgi:hypothetical protein